MFGPLWGLGNYFYSMNSNGFVWMDLQYLINHCHFLIPIVYITLPLHIAIAGTIIIIILIITIFMPSSTILTKARRPDLPGSVLASQSKGREVASKTQAGDSTASVEDRTTERNQVYGLVDMCVYTIQTRSYMCVSMVYDH